jgi:serine/threonine-protein kinase
MHLGLVHRDVSPQNILVGTDGMARVLDFGIAKAAGRTQTTREGAVKGKLGYMAPEQMAAEGITRQADLYAAAVVLWELLAGRRLFDGDTETVVLAKVLTSTVEPPSVHAPDVPKELDDVVMKGIHRKVSARYATAREMALALEKLGPAALGEVAEWLESVAAPTLSARQQLLSLIETGTSTGDHDLRALGASIDDPRSESELTIDPALPAEIRSEGVPAKEGARRRLLVAAGAAAFIALGAVMLYVVIRADASGSPSSSSDPSRSIDAVVGARNESAPAVGKQTSGGAPPNAPSPTAGASSEVAASASASAPPSASTIAASSSSGPARAPGPMPKSSAKPRGTGNVWGLGGRE